MSEKQKLLVEKLNIRFWMKHLGYEVLAGEPREVTYEIIRRLLERDMLVEDDDDGS